jgi:hypothetical protein
MYLQLVSEDGKVLADSFSFPVEPKAGQVITLKGEKFRIESGITSWSRGDTVLGIQWIGSVVARPEIAQAVVEPENPDLIAKPSQKKSRRQSL